MRESILGFWDWISGIWESIFDPRSLLLSNLNLLDFSLGPWGLVLSPWRLNFDSGSTFLGLCGLTFGAIGLIGMGESWASWCTIWASWNRFGKIQVFRSSTILEIIAIHNLFAYGPLRRRRGLLTQEDLSFRTNLSGERKSSWDTYQEGTQTFYLTQSSTHPHRRWLKVSVFQRY